MSEKTKRKATFRLKRHLIALIGLLTLIQAEAVFADVKLPAIISNNMVLQANKAVPIWGWADPGENVTVTFGGQSQSALAGADGKWKVMLKPLQVGDPQQMTVAGKNTLTLDNVLVGSVWLCSGQSNMRFTMGPSLYGQNEAKKANYPKIRLFNTSFESWPPVASVQPLDDIKGQWVECTPDSAASFSAVGYFFGRDIHVAQNIPVGLIDISVGGTSVLSWISLSGLEAIPSPDDWILNSIREAKDDLAKGITGHYSHCAYFNGMINPIIPYALEGVIWYQGEQDCGPPVDSTAGEEAYRLVFQGLIADWRKKWGEGDFPFLFVQLASIGKPTPEPSPSGRALIRDAQFKTLNVPNTGMAVTIDIGDVNEHPIDKVDVGHRLALIAEKMVFNKDIVYSGPLYKEMKMEGNHVRISFTNIGGGLLIGTSPLAQSSPPAQQPADHLVGFAICGEDKHWVWADAKIDGNTVVVSSDKVPQPVAVRYAWADDPQCNLYNKEGLPASPFRTDSF